MPHTSLEGKGDKRGPYGTRPPARQPATPTIGGGGQSSSQTGGRLSYENDHQELLSHENDIKKIRSVLNNRFNSSGRSVTGPVIRNDSNPLTILMTLAQRGNCEAKCNRQYNLKGSPDMTMIYSKLLEDSAVHLFKFKTYCEQCHDHHVEHKMVRLKIIFVTENGELFGGATSRMGVLKNPSFKNLLLKEGIKPCQVVNIEFVDICDRGVFANNLTWLTALIEKGCMAQCFIFWKAGTSFLLSGGSVEDLLEKNAIIESHVSKMEVKIRHTSVDLRHQYIPVPLVYTRDTCDLDLQDMGWSRGASPWPASPLPNSWTTTLV